VASILPKSDHTLPEDTGVKRIALSFGLATLARATVIQAVERLGNKNTPAVPWNIDKTLGVARTAR
jgi:hypothetical protein